MKNKSIKTEKWLVKEKKLFFFRNVLEWRSCSIAVAYKKENTV